MAIFRCSVLSQPDDTFGLLNSNEWAGGTAHRGFAAVFQIRHGAEKQIPIVWGHIAQERVTGIQAFRAHALSYGRFRDRRHRSGRKTVV